MKVSRREFLVVAGGGTVASVLGCGDNQLAGPDAFEIDDGGVCLQTRPDVLGPYFVPGAPARTMIADVDEPGERLSLTGRLLGPDCTTPLAGASIEVWQADRDGNYYTAAQNYRLRGELTTGSNGMFHVETIRPGNYLQGSGFRPAHVHFTFSHPAHQTLTTQIYFAGDPYLAPNDSCDTCGSSDRDRILVLGGSARVGWTGELRIVLAAT